MNKRAALIVFLVAAVGGLSPRRASAQASPEAGSPRVGFRVLHSFAERGPGSNRPFHGLVEASDGFFYGATEGGIHDKGTVFRFRPGGAVVTVHKFLGPDGDAPVGGLVQARDGNLYGSTIAGGAFGNGTLFRITPDGQLTTLFSFRANNRDGHYPSALMEAGDGNLYGTTRLGGRHGSGVVFRMSTDGAVTPVYSFNQQLDDPYDFKSRLIQARDGHLYGTSTAGGAARGGTVYRMTLDGVLTVLKSFSSTDGTDGYAPDDAVLEGLDGKLYGTAMAGGRSTGDGTLFAITTDDSFELLGFFGESLGRKPVGALVQDPDGNLYGTTFSGGAALGGTAFRMTPDRRLAPVYAFDFSLDGGFYRQLVFGSDGRLYGTASAGGVGNGGTLFGLGARRAGIAPWRRRQRSSAAAAPLE